MKSPEAIEAALARLMPAALSDEGQRAIDRMIEGLAAESAPRVVRMPRRVWPAAAAAVLLVGLSCLAWWPAARPQPASVAAAGQGDVFETLASSEIIETVADEGIVQDPAGAALRATRVRIVGQNTFRDRRTGEVVEVTAPREEMVYAPVSSF